MAAGPLRGRVVCATGMDAPERNALRARVEALGGTFSPALVRNASVLVVARALGSEKYARAVEAGIAVVRPGFVDAVSRRAGLGPIDDAAFCALCAEQRLPVFAECRVCVTGVSSAAERAALGALIVAHGGEYARELSASATHLVSGHAEDAAPSAKTLFARRAGIRIAPVSWVHDCVARGALVDVALASAEPAAGGPAEDAERVFGLSRPSQSYDYGDLSAEDVARVAAASFPQYLAGLHFYVAGSAAAPSALDAGEDHGPADDGRAPKRSRRGDSLSPEALDEGVLSPGELEARLALLRRLVLVAGGVRHADIAPERAALLTHYVVHGQALRAAEARELVHLSTHARLAGRAAPLVVHDQWLVACFHARALVDSAAFEVAPAYDLASQLSSSRDESPSSQSLWSHSQTSVGSRLHSQTSLVSRLNSQDSISKRHGQALVSQSLSSSVSHRHSQSSAGSTVQRTGAMRSVRQVRDEILSRRTISPAPLDTSAASPSASPAHAPFAFGRLRLALHAELRAQPLRASQLADDLERLGATVVDALPRVCDGSVDYVICPVVVRSAPPTNVPARTVRWAARCVRERRVLDASETSAPLVYGACATERQLGGAPVTLSADRNVSDSALGGTAASLVCGAPESNYPLRLNTSPHNLGQPESNYPLRLTTAPHNLGQPESNYPLRLNTAPHNLGQPESILSPRLTTAPHNLSQPESIFSPRLNTAPHSLSQPECSLPLRLTSFSITGILLDDRGFYTEVLRALGADVTETLCASNTHVLAADADAPSPKIAFARARGIPVVPLSVFLCAIRAGDLSAVLRPRAAPFSVRAESAVCASDSPTAPSMRGAQFAQPRPPRRQRAAPRAPLAMTVSGGLVGAGGASTEGPVGAPAEGPLAGCIVAISPRLWHKRDALHAAATSLGASFVWAYDRACTHYVHTGTRGEDAFPELARVLGHGTARVVAPLWLHECVRCNSRLDEALYPAAGGDTRSPGPSSPASMSPPGVVERHEVSLGEVSGRPESNWEDAIARDRAPVRSRTAAIGYDMRARREQPAPSDAARALVFMLSGLEPEARVAFAEALERAARDAGAPVRMLPTTPVDGWDPATTHLVTGSLVLNEKLLAACASGGVAVLGPSYVSYVLGPVDGAAPTAADVAARLAAPGADLAHEWDPAAPGLPEDQRRHAATARRWRASGAPAFSAWRVLLACDAKRVHAMATVLAAGGAAVVVLGSTRDEDRSTHRGRVRWLGAAHLAAACAADSSDVSGGRPSSEPTAVSGAHVPLPQSGGHTTAAGIGVVGIGVAGIGVAGITHVLTSSPALRSAIPARVRRLFREDMYHPIDVIIRHMHGA